MQASRTLNQARPPLAALAVGMAVGAFLLGGAGGYTIRALGEPAVSVPSPAAPAVTPSPKRTILPNQA